jgi:hypothetical protein
VALPTLTFIIGLALGYLIHIEVEDYKNRKMFVQSFIAKKTNKKDDV